jgi:hypothetical protein
VIGWIATSPKEAAIDPPLVPSINLPEQAFARLHLLSHSLFPLVATEQHAQAGKQACRQAKPALTTLLFYSCAVGASICLFFYEKHPR